ncbi:hypothetical protein M5K25_027786 [Dendrobium thyrsiflorum]|uniref:Uncharacterized protein n=1 Tax=Dendrobium thyrsiflorum TaxID=117978 RepID=A0ABD0TUN6_DENTH
MEIGGGRGIGAPLELDGAQFGGFTGFGRRSARKGESYLHSERAPVLTSDQNVVTSDPTGKGNVVEGAKSNNNERAEELSASSDVLFYASPVALSSPFSTRGFPEFGVNYCITLTYDRVYAMILKGSY